MKLLRFKEGDEIARRLLAPGVMERDVVRDGERATDAKARARAARAMSSGGILLPRLGDVLPRSLRALGLPFGNVPKGFQPIMGGAVTSKWYGQAIMLAYGSGSSGNSPNQDFLSDTIDVALFVNTYTPNQDTDDFYNDTTAGTNEVANGNGYTTNGLTLANKTLDYTSGTNVIKFDNTVDPAWTSASFTSRVAVFYDRTPATDATRPLMWYIDFGADVTVTSGTLTIVLDSAGIATITPA